MVKDPETDEVVDAAPAPEPETAPEAPAADPKPAAEEYSGETDWSSWLAPEPETAPAPVDAERIRLEEQNRILNELLRAPQGQPSQEPEADPVQQLQQSFTQRMGQLEFAVMDQSDRNAWEGIKRDIPQAAALEKEVEGEVRRLRGLGVPATREQAFTYLVGKKALGNLKRPATPKKVSASPSSAPVPKPSERGQETLEELENRLRGVPI